MKLNYIIKKKISVFILIFFMCPIVAFAENKDINVKADKLFSYTDKNYIEFIGNVKSTQSGNTMKADKIKFFYKNDDKTNSIEKIVAIGNVLITTKDKKKAMGDSAEYIAEDKSFILIGNASLADSQNNTVFGNKITFYQNKEEIIAEGSATKQMEAKISIRDE